MSQIRTKQVIYDSPISFSGGTFKISNLAAGASANDAVTKSQLDALESTINNFEWQESVKSVELDSSNIVGPVTGDRYLIDGPGVNDFAGQDNNIAEYNGATWDFITPTVGTFVAADDEPNKIYLYSGTWAAKEFEQTTASTGLTKVGFDIRLDATSAGNGLDFAAGTLSVDALDGTITVAPGGISVGTITSAKVSDFTTAAETAIFTDANFVDSSTINFDVTAGASASANVIDGSLDELKLQGITAGSTGFNGEVLLSDGAGGFVWGTDSTVGATNGLTKVGSDIKLGGTLVENTTVDGSFDLSFGSGPSPLNNFNVFGPAFINGGATGNVIVTTLGGDAILSSASGTATVSGATARIEATQNDLTLAGGNAFENTFVMANDNTTTFTHGVTAGAGIQYGASYSSNYTNRSLTDKEYVDTEIANAVTAVGATNGLTEISSGVIGLGGTLVENTTVDGATAYSLTLDNLTSYTAQTDQSAANKASTTFLPGIVASTAEIGAATSSVQQVGANVTLQSNGTTAVSTLALNNGITTLSATDFSLSLNSTTDTATFTDSTASPAGIQYGASYSSNYTNRSLVDKEFVDTEIADAITAASPLQKRSVDTAIAGTGEGATAVLDVFDFAPSANGIPQVFINGQLAEVTEDNSGDAYFGTTSAAGVAFASLAGTENLYWNGTTVGFDLDTNDKIIVHYTV